MESRRQALQLHREYGRKIQAACKKYDGVRLSRALRRLGDEFCEDFEDLLRGNIEAATKEGARAAQRIIDQMLPKGVKPPGKEQTPDFWTSEYKGDTPARRMARLTLNVRRKLNSVTTLVFSEAPVLSAKVASGLTEEELYGTVADALWTGEIERAVGLMAAQDAWAGDVLGYAATLEDNNSVMDHWEHLATLDATTCEECAALDGRPIDIGGGDVEEEPWELVDIHPNCRCVPVPVSKTWAELGEELGIEGWKDIPDPEGTRIARTDEKGQASPTGFIDQSGKYHEWVPKLDAEGHLVGDNWQPGWTPTGGNQYYVDAGTRYMDWAAENPNYAGDWFIPPEPEGGVPSAPEPEPEPEPPSYGAIKADDAYDVYEEWGNNLTDADKDALNKYPSREGLQLLDKLRAGEKLTSAEEKWVKTLDDVLKRQELGRDVKVWRGMGFKEGDPFFDLITNKGSVFTDDGFVSTTLDKKVARDFAKGSTAKGDIPCLVQVNAPSNLQAGFMNARQGIKEYASVGEQELLLPRGLDFKVDSAKMVKGVWQIVVSVV